MTFATTTTIAATARTNATATVLRIDFCAEMDAAFLILGAATEMSTAIMTKMTAVSVHLLLVGRRFETERLLLVVQLPRKINSTSRGVCPSLIDSEIPSIFF